MDIDIVLIWVDGNDPEWQSKFKKYKKEETGESVSLSRYRDWDNLQYIFRGIEKFAPWVRKVHFVTCGHYPSWLNLNHPKLNFVKHSDYIPKEYLPVFSANPIEINLHRIRGLSEKFVYFNDDTFLTNYIKESDFFKNEKPCDVAVVNAWSRNMIAHIDINNMEIINKYFDKYSIIKKRPFDWFNFKYGKEMLRTLCLMPWPRFTGMWTPHQPQPFLRSTFEILWDKESDILEKTSYSKFRNANDVNQYLFRAWQIVSGNFCPSGFYRNTKSTVIEDSTIDNICKEIKTQKYKMMCLNDGETITFEDARLKLIKAFEFILPEKSSFEK